MSNGKCIEYIDYQGKTLPHHDGRLIPIDENTGIQYFDIEGRGFLHDGSPVKMKNGKMQFFLHDGTAIVHDGSPIKLSNGQTQFFNENGCAMWPIDVDRLNQLNYEQFDVFFKRMVKRINKETPLTSAETEDIRLIFLAAERPDSEESKNIAWCEDNHSTRIKPISDETAHYLMNLEVIWLRVWTKYKLRHKETLAARFAINWQKNEGCLLAKLRSAESMLVDELMLELTKAEKIILPPTNYDELNEFGLNEKGIFELDDRLNSYVKNMRKGAGTERFLFLFKEACKPKKISIEERRKCWREPLYMHRCIADVVWYNSVREKVESAYRKPPALTLFTWGVVTTPFKAKKIRADKDKILDQNNNEIGSIKSIPYQGLTAIDISTISNILAKQNIELLKSINFHRLFRWEIKEVTKRYLSGVADFRKLSIEGSFQELARLIGASTHKQTIQDLREILTWQQQAVFKLGDDNIGHMLTYDIRSSAQDRRRKILSLYLTDMLLPNFVFSISKKYQSQRELRMIVPLLDIPPLVTSNNRLHAAQAAFQVEICIEMRKRAKEIAERGGIYLPYNQKAILAESVGLDLETLPKVFDRWTRDGDDGPKMLDEIEENVYVISENHREARDFIIEAGRIEKAAAIRGSKPKKRSSKQ